MKTIRVLIVEDSLTIRAILEALLEQHSDIEIVATASTIGEARRALWERRPHVITLDLALPGEDGWDFLDYLSRTSHAPVLVVSSSTAEGTSARANAIRLGAHACFDKARLVQDAAAFMKALRKAASKAYTTVDP